MKFIHSKNIISFVCILLCAQLILSGSLFVFTQLRLKVNVSNWIKTPAAEKYLQKIELTSLEFEKLNWLESNEEFEWKGDYYDVAKLVKTGKKVTVFCFNDKKESELCKAFEKQQKNKQNKKTTKNLKLLSYNSLSNRTSFICTIYSKNYCSNISCNYPIAPYLEVSAPPPDLI